MKRRTPGRIPYGVWTCPDGREVLFDRQYRPMLQRQDGDPATPADPDEWVQSIASERWLWTSATPRREREAAASAILAEWGAGVCTARPRRSCRHLWPWQFDLSGFGITRWQPWKRRICGRSSPQTPWPSKRSHTHSVRRSSVKASRRVGHPDNIVACSAHAQGAWLQFARSAGNDCPADHPDSCRQADGAN